MQDVAPELYKKLKSTFENKCGADEKIEEISKLIDTGKGTYKDAADYAVRTGQILGETFSEHLSGNTLPDGKMYYNIAQRTVAPMLKNNHVLVSKKCEAVQRALNEVERLGLKAIVPELNEEYIKEIVDKASDFDEVEKMLDYLIQTAVSFSQSVVDDSVRQNAKFQSESGLQARVYRYFRPGLTNQKTHHERKYWQCPYCKERECPEGVPYEEVEGTGAWIWQRHPGCNCVIEYKPSRGRKQIVPPTRRREVQKNLERAAKNGKIISGGRILDPNTDEANQWAQNYYAEIRKKSTDYIKIAKRLGYEESEIKRIKDYLFSDTPRYQDPITGKMKPFDPDAAIAQSWQRVAEGKEYYEHDVILFKHEMLEMKIKRENPNISHYEAHDLATKQYNYREASEKFYDNIRKRKK